ncbi:MAG: hypothetical protein ACRC17_00670 [Culicoidibacterales bacterium]
MTNKLEEIINAIESEKKFVMENYFMSENQPTCVEYKQVQAQMFAFDTALTVIAKKTNTDYEAITEDEAIMEQQQAELNESRALATFAMRLIGLEPIQED